MNIGFIDSKKGWLFEVLLEKTRSTGNEHIEPEDFRADLLERVKSRSEVVSAVWNDRFDLKIIFADQETLHLSLKGIQHIWSLASLATLANRAKR